MRQTLVTCLLAGMLVTSAIAGQEHEKAYQQRSGSFLFQDRSTGTPGSEQNSKTWKLRGCLLEESDKEYDLMDTDARHWIVKSESIDLSLYRHRWIQVTLLKSEYNEGPFIVVSVDVAQGKCADNSAAD